MTTQKGDEPYQFDWAGLVPRVVHPLKVAVVEAIAWIGQPLSPAELYQVFDREFGLSLIAYHVNGLDSLGVLEAIASRPVRGVRQTFYYFTELG